MRLVVAEDQVLLRDGLVRLLERAGHTVVAQVGDARALVEQVNAHRPDVVIADIRMPPDYTNDGARAALYLRTRFPGLPIVMLTQVIDASVLAAFVDRRAPAFGYLLKDRVLDTDSFLERLQVVAGGGTAIDPTLVDERRPREGAELLSEREAEVMRLLASGRSNSGIAEQLLISRRTVDAHLRAIFAKLGIDAAPSDNPRVLAVRAWLDATRPEGVQDGTQQGAQR